MKSAGNFDPYYEWLAIPLDQRPPTHYQILGIAPTETNARVIETAAIRQSSFIRTFQAGQNGEAAAKILAEIAEARAVLTDAGRRKKYDAENGVGKAASPAVEVDTGIRPSSKSGLRDPVKVVKAEPIVEVEPEEVDVEVVAARKPKRKASTSSYESESNSQFVRMVFSVLAIGGLVVVGIIVLRNMKKDDIQAQAPPLFSKEELDRKANRDFSSEGSDRSRSNSEPPKNDNRSIGGGDRSYSSQPLDASDAIGQLNFIAKQASESKGRRYQPRDLIENELVVDEALSILSKPGAELTSFALSHLAECTPNHRSKEVEDRALILARSKEHTRMAIAVLMKWDCDSAWPTILSMAKSDDAQVAYGAVESLGLSRRAGVLDILTDAFHRSDTRGAAMKAFCDYGPDAEEAVVKIMKDASESVFVDACDVLRKIGGKEAIRALQSPSRSSDAIKSSAAQSTIRYLRVKMQSSSDGS